MCQKLHFQRTVYVLLATVVAVHCEGLRQYNCNVGDSVVVGNRGIISHSTNEDTNCQWNITIPHPGLLTLTLEDLNIPEVSGACDSSLEIAARGGEVKVYKLCGNEPEQTTYNFTSTEAKQVQIIFKSKNNTSTRPANFTLSYLIDCDRRISGQEGQFTSPNYPDKYFDGFTCNSYFKQPNGTLVELYFVEINVKSDDTQCLQDYVAVTRSTAGTTERYCNKKLPRGKILIDPNKDAVKFVSSDENGQGDGFVANWAAVSTFTIPTTTTKPDKPDLAWVALVAFAVLTVGVIIFIAMWAKKDRPTTPRTPTSQYSDTVFEFDEEHMERQHSFRTVGSDTSSLRSSARGRISKKWNINDSVVAKKRAFKRQLNDNNHAPSTCLHSLSQSVSLRQTSLDDTGTYVTPNQLSPPPRYDSFFRQYSTRRARVPQSQYLPRSAEYNTMFGEFTSTDSLDERGSKCNGFDDCTDETYGVLYLHQGVQDTVVSDSDHRRVASVREYRRMWRSTDSVPEQWRATTPIPSAKTSVEEQVQSDGTRSPVIILSTVKNEGLNELEHQVHDQIENKASPNTDHTIFASSKTEKSSDEILQHEGADDILPKIIENSTEEHCEMKSLDNKTTEDPMIDENTEQMGGEKAHESPGNSKT